MAERIREPTVTAELAAEHGLSPDEYQRLVSVLGRVPTFSELGVASVMWSEHCSYKSSRIHLKTMPTEGPHVIQGPGENAGVVDIGDGQAVVFKMESHNHPSFLEPYQGAATGVGGICRDVFTMGARPIALADCLRFGRPENPRTRHLIGGVVAGIGGYGNAFGVPNVAGDVAFDRSYDGNILVNAFCLGVADADRIFLGRAAGVGNPVLYVGAKTGRDGIHGATMASAEFAEDDEEAKEKRPAVQVGDPFLEKLLLEACLELMQGDILVGIQDMGAAGLTSSSVEMAARAGSGLDLDVERVPQREEAMTPYEILLSESQERMLMVVEKGREDQALAIFDKWDLDAAVIGVVTDSGRLRVRMDGVLYTDLPVDLLAEGLSYDRPSERPAYLDEVAEVFSDDVARLPALNKADKAGLSGALLALLAHPDIASKAWVYRQYDHNVRHGTVVRPGAAGAGVVRVFAPSPAEGDTGGDAAERGQKGVAISAGCISRYVYLAPYEGSRLVVAEAYANLVAVGAKPLAVTDCLNFGNPERPEIMWQFIESVRGLGDACRQLEVPVVSGNVSLYNETDGNAIKPTPMIAMVGLLDDAGRHVTAGFPAPVGDSGHDIAVIFSKRHGLAGALDGSVYLEHHSGRLSGTPVALDSDGDSGGHMAAFSAMGALVREGLVTSAQDASDGGLAVAVAESAICARRPLGVDVDIPAIAGPGGDPVRDDAVLFGEAPARFVVSFSAHDRLKVEALVAENGAQVHVIGHTVARHIAGGDTLTMRIGGKVKVQVAMKAAEEAWSGAFAAIADE